jgi:MFS family permease
VNNIGFATASAIGPSVGGVLSDNASWRWIFLINVPLCLATMAIAQLWVLLSFAVVGMGTGFTAPSLMIAFQNSIPHARLGAGMGPVQLVAGLVVVVMAWLMADLPLGTSRAVFDVEPTAKGKTWSRVPADR